MQSCAPLTLPLPHRKSTKQNGDIELLKTDTEMHGATRLLTHLRSAQCTGKAVGGEPACDNCLAAKGSLQRSHTYSRAARKREGKEPGEYDEPVAVPKARVKKNMRLVRRKQRTAQRNKTRAAELKKKLKQMQLRAFAENKTVGSDEMDDEVTLAWSTFIQKIWRDKKVKVRCTQV